MKEYKEKYKELLKFIKENQPFTTEIAIVLGSGLGDFASSVEIIKSIPTSEIPDYPSSTVEGHKGYIHFAKYNNRNLILFQGRIHFYEGYGLLQCILPIIIAKETGTKFLLLSNAAGGVNPLYNPGDLMLIESFNSINLKKELSSITNSKNKFYSNSDINFSSIEFKNLIKKVALEEQVDLKVGNYWYCKGPNYETPAEVKMISYFDGDAVGMSTVHEAIWGMLNGLQVGAISCITNFAAGISNQKLYHGEVMEVAELVKPKFEKLIKAIISKI